MHPHSHVHILPPPYTHMCPHVYVHIPPSLPTHTSTLIYTCTNRHHPHTHIHPYSHVYLPPPPHIHTWTRNFKNKSEIRHNQGGMAHRLKSVWEQKGISIVCFRVRVSKCCKNDNIVCECSNKDSGALAPALSSQMCDSLSYQTSFCNMVDVLQTEGAWGEGDFKQLHLL